MNRRGNCQAGTQGTHNGQLICRDGNTGNYRAYDSADRRQDMRQAQTGADAQGHRRGWNQRNEGYFPTYQYR